MSSRNDNTDIWAAIMAIFTILAIMTMSQCESGSEISRELRGIQHELRMLRFEH